MRSAELKAAVFFENIITRRSFALQNVVAKRIRGNLTTRGK